MRWTRALGIPMSEGGMPICSKHEFIESNLGDADMGYEMSQAVSAASKDGQNMEDALKARKEQIEEANGEIEYMEREIRRLRIAHLRRMSDACLLISMQASSKLPRFPTEGQWKRFFAKQNRWSKFRTTCRAEIARLTQPR
jgi:hypothetical protein